MYQLSMIHFPIEGLLNLGKGLSQEPDTPAFQNSIVGDARAEKRARRWVLAIQLLVGAAFLAFAAFVIWAAAL